MIFVGIGKHGKLTNEKQSTLYGEVASWTVGQRRLLASCLLKQAFDKYVDGGEERQTFPDEVRR